MKEQSNPNKLHPIVKTMLVLGLWTIGMTPFAKCETRRVVTPSPSVTVTQDTQIEYPVKISSTQ